jgi:hypothetical protein
MVFVTTLVGWCVGHGADMLHVIVTVYLAPDIAAFLRSKNLRSSRPAAAAAASTASLDA